MVSAAFLLLTVSSLAAHIIAIPTKELGIQHACKGKTLCDVKPANYPQEMIDHLVKLNLHRLHRKKREIGFVTADTDTNNCVNNTQMKKFYTRIHENGLSHVIVQSKFFSQTVPEVTCYEKNQPCFGDLSTDEATFVCKPVYTPITLAILKTYTDPQGHTQGEVIHELVEVPTNCRCEKRDP